MESGGTKQDYDLTFPNICVQGDIWTMIDYEWTTDKLTPQQIISRALNCYGQEDPVRMVHPIVYMHLEALGIGKEQMYELSKKSWRSSILSCRKRTVGPDGPWTASASDRQPSCAVSGIFARADRKRCRYLKTSAQDIHRSILIINMMHMRRTI